MKNNKNKRILFLVNHDWFFTSHRLPIAIECVKQKYDVHLGSNFSESKDIYLKNGIHTHQINISRTSINPFKSLLELLEIIKLFSKVRPDIVHLISHKPMIYGCLASLLFNKIKIVSSVSGLGYVFSDKKLTSLIIKNLILNLYKLCFYRKNVRVIFQNSFDRDIFQKITNLKKQQILMIPGSGVKISDYEFKPIQEGRPNILFAGRLIHSKGLNEFVKAAKLNRNANFLIAGKVDSESKDFISINQIKSWTQNNNVEYLGFSTNVRELIYKASIVVLPSYYGEGLPKILIEASACGRPIITTYNHGCLAAIDQYKTGLAVPAKDYFSLSQAIDYLLSNRYLLEQMGLNARKKAEKLFNIDNVINAHINVYNSL